MDEMSSAKKSSKTNRNKTSGEKAAITKKRKKIAQGIADEVKNKQWEPEKIEHLKFLENKTKKEACVCIVCSDNRQNFLQDHHIEPEKEINFPQMKIPIEN